MCAFIREKFPFSKGRGWKGWLEDLKMHQKMRSSIKDALHGLHRVHSWEAFVIVVAVVGGLQNSSRNMTLWYELAAREQGGTIQKLPMDF